MSVISVEQLTGQSESHIHWLSDAIGVHNEILQSWLSMQQEAKSAGFDLVIASGFRNFNRQLNIWNRKFLGLAPIKNRENELVDIGLLSDKEKLEAILLYSALPGASRHHWGTDIDVYAPNLLPKNQKLQLEPWEYQKDGYFYALTCWLKSHASNFGFYFPYDEYRGGVAEEPWHLSHIKTADKLQNNLSAVTLRNTILNSEIEGKSCIIENLDWIIETYVLNIGNCHE